jgi:hypothetical protein
MANQGTQGHSKALGNYRKAIFGTLASTLKNYEPARPDLCRTMAEVSEVQPPQIGLWIVDDEKHVYLN